jgi:hypothetical protein
MPILAGTGSIACVLADLNYVVQVKGGDAQTAKSNLNIGYNNAVCLGGPTSADGDGTFGRHIQVGLKRNDSDGSPLSQTPCLQLTYPGLWRFRWSVQAGVRSLYINAKQPDNGISGQRPMMVVKANPSVGLSADLMMSSAAGSDWLTIGPLTFTATAAGMVWVEVHNHCQTSNYPALFDHIVTT